MAIIINHRFIDRLTPIEGIENVNTIIIGTFNPGLPMDEYLNDEERTEFQVIYQSVKFRKFNIVKNFYDRPQNRFWKIMDWLNEPDFYNGKSLKTKNHKGLKFYSKMNREDVFERQKAFCKSKGIWITDIVKTINPKSFNKIYDSFPDSAVDKASPAWNNENIISAIEKFSPSNVIINFKPDSKSIPNISKKIDEIRSKFSKIGVSTLASTSGSAGNSYVELMEQWKNHLPKVSS